MASVVACRSSTAADGAKTKPVAASSPTVVEGAQGTWVTIESGGFQMGSPESETRRNRNETQHAVTLTHRFRMLATEVTQGSFAAVMGYNPSAFCGEPTRDESSCRPDGPVENVTWHEAAAYCNALSAAEGLRTCYSCQGDGEGTACVPDETYAAPYDCQGYRLPTEAEWEYAARAGDPRATYNGDLDAGQLACEQPNDVLDAIAWFCGTTRDAIRQTAGDRTGHGDRWLGGTKPVRAKAPNARGLYDMLGNVEEWCHDWYGGDLDEAATDPWGPPAGSIRVTRGGSWASHAWNARAAFRLGKDPAVRYDRVGLRPVRTMPR